MLKLRKVELIGFKSFCERTQITFSGTGITCIVGPNGCGKSNIVDAISWVLGEQSHKSLRAERMADCIFNGTAKRPPLGLAEVTLTLVDPELAEAAKFVLEGGTESSQQTGEGPETATPEAAAEANAEAFRTESADGADFREDPGTPPEKARRYKRAIEKPPPHMKPGEVVIGRRLYRSGQSEYLIDGRVVRLRDIQELFMGMGLGPDSYAIIEQGRIGQVLSSKPTDRRAIIEEAAGVTKYKTKKRLAEAKLESSKINLSRVHDILVEVEKQLGSLKRQASKARRYAEIREQMRALLRQVLASKAKELDQEAERLSGLLRDAAANEAEQVKAVGQMEIEQEQLSARTYQLDGELRQNQNLLGQAALELDRAENRILFNRQRSEEIEARIQQLSGEIEQTTAQIAQLNARAEAHGRNLTALRQEALDLEKLLEQLGELGAQFASSAQQAETRISELRTASTKLTEELTRLHGEQAQADQSLENHLEAQARFEESERRLLEESLQHRARAESAELHWQSTIEKARSLEQSVKRSQLRIAELRRDEQQAQARSEQARDALAVARARRSSLEQILNDRAYMADAVQKLFASNGPANESAFRAVGVLADYAEVEEEYESAIEQFLRDELEYVVVETFDHARAGIAILRDEVGGRATFFVDSLRNLNPKLNQPVLPFRPGEGVVSRLDKLVEFRDPVGAVAKQFLPRLQSAYLVETAAAAEKLAGENPHLHFVAVDGTCYQGRMVSGGRPAEAGPLVMKRELRKLEAETFKLERAAAETQAALEDIEGALGNCERELQDAGVQHMAAEKAAVAATHDRDQARSELARLGMELGCCQKEVERVRTAIEAARSLAEQAQHKHREASKNRTAAEEEMTRLIEQLGSLRQLAAAHQEELATRRAEKATVTERVSSAELLAARTSEELRESRERAVSLTEQQAALANEQQRLRIGSAEHEQQVHHVRAEKARLEEHKAELEREWDQARTRGVAVEDALRMSRQKLGDLREERSRFEVERARNDAERDHLRESSLAELNLHPEDLIAQETSLLHAEELTAAEANYREMKGRVEAMGPVNMMALEEFNECEQRFTFLGRERDDLLQSIADTQQAILELNEVSRQKFEEAFAVINANFAEAFRTLFGGGTGEMRLTEPDSSGEPGIDVAAQPLGKRLQNVLLLSGGEKALTALALLIAIFRYQPSPFCILDEVDAPLDEANVGRFANLVAEMSAQTQFLIVTHNRRTMEMAPVLYGVTMQEPGVSKLVSVRWDDQLPTTPNRGARATSTTNAA